MPSARPGTGSNLTGHVQCALGVPKYHQTKDHAQPEHAQEVRC